ncbi:hypothetical protein J6590_042705 [Homalodisca vitripennis]|nr:hypothetical protein J6590_042705 [Homalodisca vitripennis]
MNEDHEKAVLSWLEETDFSEGNISILDNVSDSDLSSEHSEHKTDTNQSGDEDVNVILQNDIDAVIPGSSQQRKRPSPNWHHKKGEDAPSVPRGRTDSLPYSNLQYMQPEDMYHTQTSTYMCHSCGQDTDSNDE